MPPKSSTPSGNPPKNIPGEPTPGTPTNHNIGTTQIISPSVSLRAITPTGEPAQKISPPTPLRSSPGYDSSTILKKAPQVLPQLGSEVTDQIRGSSGFSSHQKTTSESKATTESKFEFTETSSSETTFQSSRTTITKISDARARFISFRLSVGGMLHAKFKNDIGEFEEQVIDLDNYLGFENGILSWEATRFSSVSDAKIEIRGNEIFAVYKGRTSHVDLCEKVRIFEGKLTILSFSTRMYSQIPWMNFRILALPTMNYEIEAMITRSTASIASSTVKTASTRLQKELTKLVETTMISVYEEINRRVQMEVECLKESMQMTLKRELFATMQTSLRGPLNWDTMREEFEGGHGVKINGHGEEYTTHSGFIGDVTAYNGGNQSVKHDAHSVLEFVR